MNTQIDRDVRLLAVMGLLDKWAALHDSGGYVTSEFVGGELGLQPSVIRRDMAGLTTGAKRGRGFDVALTLAAIEGELGQPHTTGGPSRKTIAAARAFNVRALANLAIGTTTARPDVDE